MLHFVPRLRGDDKNRWFLSFSNASSIKPYGSYSWKRYAHAAPLKSLPSVYEIPKMSTGYFFIELTRYKKTSIDI